MGHALDAMLNRLQATVERERRFISDASHELRTPLAVARVQAESLQGQSDPAVVREGLTALTRRIDGLTALVDDLLTLASADEEPGRLVEPRWVSVADYVDDLERDLPLLSDRHLTVHRCGGQILVDPGRLDQVLRNLVANATRHTAPDGHVDISFVPDADRLRVEVRDDGEGMSPEAAARVFERFGRGDAGHRSGTGLGLPISRALVRAHGGTISVESQLGAGTLARVTLPGYRGGLTES